jgi:hypothetical protein
VKPTTTAISKWSLICLQTNGRNITTQSSEKESTADFISWFRRAAEILGVKNYKRLKFTLKFQFTNICIPTINLQQQDPYSLVRTFINFNMFYKFLLATTTVAIFAAQAAAAPSVKTGSEMKASSNNDSRAVFIAPDAIDACNCPDDCQHKLGDSCKFYKEGNIVTASR